MRMSRLHAPTLKETPRDVEVVSHRYLMRGGFMRQLAAGIYDLLPLGWRSVRKVEAIIREEMDRAGAQEVLMPAVQPADIWKESGRWDYYGAELLRLVDRKGGEFCVGPTHEEVVTDLVRRDVRSYRQLPLNLYQIQSKFRDEVRPRAGLLRGREFIMKDSYSFDVSEEAARVSYDVMYDTYMRIFRRCGLDFRPVEADTGNIGGNLSHEFQVLADSGEDAIVSCASCGYTANVEKAELGAAVAVSAGVRSAVERVETPGARKVEEVAAALGIPVQQIVKTVIFDADGALVAVLVRGDVEVNEVKVKAVLGATQIRLASDEQVRTLTGAAPGFAGPVGLSGASVLADESVRGLEDVAVGANETDAHLVHVSIERDVVVSGWHDLRLAGDGDACGRCGGAFRAFRGIEVGQVFYLGTKYSAPMKATFLDEAGEERPMVMGCYGIGVTRVLAAAIEQNHDERGIVWPMALAPYQVMVLPLQMNQEAVVEAAERLYAELQAAGVEVLLDDREARAGAKFADADLIGVPLRVQIGSRGLADGKVELRDRRAEAAEDVALDAVVDRVVAEVRARLEQERSV